MKKHLLLLLLFSAASFVFAQQLVKETSLPRADDVLHKTRLNYLTSGPSGMDVLWDFSTLQEAGGTDYKVSYIGKIDSVLSLLESRTQYRYKLSSDSLLSIGYENATIRINNSIPEVSLCYPFSYGDSIGSYFYGRGSYSHSLPVSSYGFSTTVADGLGRLKLPNLDTLHQVLRIRHDRFIGQTYHKDEQTGFENLIGLRDSIRIWLMHNPVTWHVVHFQWYAPGYRYPVLETFENSIYQSGTLNKHFNTAFYHSPIEQEYLEDDPINQAIREQQAFEVEKKIGNKRKAPSASGLFHPKIALEYSLSVGNQLALTYQVNEPAQLELILTTVSGIVLYHQPAVTVPTGVYTKQIDVSGYTDNEFVFCTIVNGQQESMKIVAK